MAKVVLASAFATGFAFTHRRRGIELKEIAERKREIDEKIKRGTRRSKIEIRRRVIELKETMDRKRKVDEKKGS